MILSDGSALCDRCGVELEGYGVLHGMVSDDRDGVKRIFCYVNDCRDVVTNDLINFAVPGECVRDSTTINSTGVAIMCTDLDPVDGMSTRKIGFCYVGGCADLLLAQIGTL